MQTNLLALPSKRYGRDRKQTRLLPSLFLIGLKAWVLLYLSTSSHAADPPEITQLDPIIVSASTLPTPQAQTPASVTVIRRMDIEKQHAHRMSEILQGVAGLHVDELGGRGGISSVYLRGADPNLTLIMIDGVPINDPTNQRGGSVDLSSITPERIEQIEIIRGPLSALYGSEAVAGVINIITQSGGNEFQQRIRASGGRFGFTRGLFQVKGPLGPLTHALSFSHTQNDDQVEGDRFELGTIGWHIRSLPEFPADVQFTGQFTNTTIRSFPEGSGGPRLAILRDTEERKTYDLVSGIHLTHDLTDHWQQRFSIQFFRRVQDGHNPGVLSAPSIFRIPPNNFESAYTRIQPSWRQTLKLTSELTLTGGVQVTTEIGTREGIQRLTALGAPADQNTRFKNTRSTIATFAEFSATVFSDLHITGGIRVDVPEGFETEVSPRIAVRYQATPSTRFRAGYGEGFKLPSMTSLGDPIIGNSRLRPETSQGWDIGIQQSIADQALEIELTYFYNRFSHLIDLNPSLARMNIFRLVNLQTVITQGIELSARISPLPELWVKGFVTYLDTNIQGLSDPLRNRPMWSGGIIFTVEPTASWTIRTQIKATGTRFDFQIPTQNNEVGSYVKADLAITYRPTPPWRFFGIVENFTNTAYEEFLGFPGPRVFFKIGLEYAH